MCLKTDWLYQCNGLFGLFKHAFCKKCLVLACWAIILFLVSSKASLGVCLHLTDMLTGPRCSSLVPSSLTHGLQSCSTCSLVEGFSFQSWGCLFVSLYILHFDFAEIEAIQRSLTAAEQATTLPCTSEPATWGSDFLRHSPV